MANLIDSMVKYVSPNAALKRERARLVLSHLENASARKYEGASRSPRTSNWMTSNSSQNSENLGDLAILRDRARDLVRNNPYARRGVQAIVNNTIGDGIVPRPYTFDKTISKDLSGKALTEWYRWAESSKCDFDQRLNVYGIQSLVFKTAIESGECLVRRIWTKNGNKASFRLQVLEPDYLDIFRNQKTLDGGYIIQGVEFDKYGNRVAYWIFPQHPGDYLVREIGILPIRVPAQDIIHVYSVERAGQVRGVSWLAPVMLKLRDFDEYEDAQILKQKIAACFTVFIQKNIEIESPTVDIHENLEPGAAMYLNPGETVAAANPPSIEGYTDFSRITLLGISTGLGVPYEVLTSDLSNVNFSSGRMGWIEFNRNIKAWRSQVLYPCFLDTLWTWFQEGSLLNGNDFTPLLARWIPPRREMIDPSKEVEANTAAVLSGQKNISEVAAENGYDFEEMMNEKQSENELLDKLGIVLTSDARKIQKVVDTSNNKGDSNAQP